MKTKLERMIEKGKKRAYKNALKRIYYEMKQGKNSCYIPFGILNRDHLIEMLNNDKRLKGAVFVREIGSPNYIEWEIEGEGRRKD